MSQTQQIDIVFAVLDGKEIPVYGRDLLHHMLADGEHMPLAIARVPIWRVESAQVLEAYCAGRRTVRYIDMQKAALHVPGLEQDLAMRDSQQRDVE